MASSSATARLSPFVRRHRLVFLLELCLAVASPSRLPLALSAGAADAVAFPFDKPAGRRAEEAAATTPRVEEKDTQQHQQEAKRWCTVVELLPRPTDGVRSSEWSDEDEVEPPYDCACPSMKGRYFCPSLGHGGYPRWRPSAVTEGACRSVTRSDMMPSAAPLPPDFKVLFYGNSHMRQAVESIMCLFQDNVVAKRVSKVSPSQGGKEQGGQGGNDGNGGSGYTQYDGFVHGDEQCRACFDPERPNYFMVYQQALEDFSCIAGAEACRCYDDHGEYLFDNGATVHFFFASDQPDKIVADALELHGGVPFSHYDAVFANQGNDPHMTTEAVLDSAIEIHAEDVPFFWLSTFEGSGDLGNDNYWSDRERQQFREAGANFVGIDRMVRGLERLTKGAVENVNDPHFCLPGPTDEIGLLLLQIAWAAYHQKLQD